MKIPLIDVNLAHMPLKIPIIGNPETTRRIAQIVNERLEQIEKESNSIDTHRFALEAAMRFAAELEQTQQAYADYKAQAEAEEKQENRDILFALDKIAENLRSILENTQGSDGKRE